MFKTVTLSFVAFVLVAASSSSHAAPSCHVPPFKMIWDVTVTATMQVTAGKRCTIVINNSTGGTHAFTLTRHPANGTVEIDGLKVRYTPKAGFVGKDSFSYIRHANNHRTNQPMKLPVEVDVTVTPQ